MSSTRHSDEKAREQMLKESQLKSQKHTTFPSYIKPWKGEPLHIKKLDPSAVTPTKSNSTDAGYDLYAIEDLEIGPHNQKLVKTGISMAIPKGYVGLIWPRSGLAHKHGIDVFAGVIDAGYRGDIGVILYNSKLNHYKVNKGDRVAQILLQKVENFELIEVSELNNTDRDIGGFGSTGV